MIKVIKTNIPCVSPKFQQAPPGCQIILCANKCDLPAERWQITREEFNSFANSNGFSIFEASASTGHQVYGIFEELSRHVLAHCRQDLAKVNVESDDNNELFKLAKPKKSNCACIVM